MPFLRLQRLRVDKQWRSQDVQLQGRRWWWERAAPAFV